MLSPASRAVVIAALVAVMAVGGAGFAAGQEAPSTSTTMRVVLDASGDATWSVTLRFSIDSANETRAFERLATEFESGEAGVLSTTPFREAASLAAAETGRPMSIENVSRSGEHHNDTGELVLSFRWTNFSRTNGDRIELGDVFTTGSGTWLPALSDGQELIVEFPAGYAPINSSHRLRNGTIHVGGPTQFAPGEPSVTLVRTEPTDTPGTATPPERAGGIPPVAGAALLVVLVGALVYFARHRSERPDGAGAAVAMGGNGDDPDDEEPLLSDEERVLRLLHGNGGRMKQVDIVEETDWSNAKVSQLLSGMAADGRVEKLRIGRENLISVPDRPPNER